MARGSEGNTCGGRIPVRVKQLTASSSVCLSQHSGCRPSKPPTAATARPNSEVIDHGWGEVQAMWQGGRERSETAFALCPQCSHSY